MSHIKILGFLLFLIILTFLLIESILAIKTVDVYPTANATYFIGNESHMYTNVTAEDIAAPILCDWIYGGTDSDFCADAEGAGGAGENFWEVEGIWMFPNMSTSAKNYINITALNATYINATKINATIEFCIASDCVTDWFDLTNTSNEMHVAIDNNTYHKYSETINMSNISTCSNDDVIKMFGGSWRCKPDLDTNVSTECSTDEILLGDANCLTLQDGWNRTDQGNSSNEMHIAIDNYTYHKHSETLTWTNISTFNLNSSWENYLGGGNISNYSLTALQLTADVGLKWANLTGYPSTCTASQYISALGDTLTCAAIAIGEEQITVDADWDIGGYELRAETFESDVATGTAPFIVASSTEVINLNASYCSVSVNTTDLICTDCIGGTEISELADADVSDTLTASDLVAGSSVVSDSEVVDDITITSTKNINTTRNVNASINIYASNFCFVENCSVNMTFNSSNLIIYG